MERLYNLSISLFRLGISIAAVRNKKAAQWMAGRKHLFEGLRRTIPGGEKLAWVHCASAGELEQGKPLIEALKEAYPGIKVLVTFFSPSGYTAGEKYAAADYIAYLPLDTARNAKMFLDIVQPRIVLFVKYEFWHHMLSAIDSRGIPLLLVSSIFRANQLFFKKYGGFYRKLLKKFTWIFVQDSSSLHLLQSVGIQNCSIGGDTRFDRVSTIAKGATGIDGILEFAAKARLLVAGSTWGDDEKLLGELLPTLPPDCKIILAPHEITEAHILHITSLFPGAQRYSARNSNAGARVMIIDNVGMLSRLYQYATLAYIGGGFNKSGIHNTLEAAVWGKPVIFGPNFTKFAEARGLIEFKAGFSIRAERQLNDVVHSLLTDSVHLARSSEAAAAFVKHHRGATAKVITYIQENRLLTMA